MAGQQVGGGSGAMPRTSGLRAQKEVQAATSAEIERLAAAAVAGLGLGKGAAAKPASFSIRQLTLGWIDWHRFTARDCSTHVNVETGGAWKTKEGEKK